MDVAQPISSEIDSVEFSFLSPEEIRRISVQRIENDSTFDSMLNPVPGGLYDLTLGSWGDSPCGTCNLNNSSCPGHPGHIQLPVPVYHPTFFDQAYCLLRATCVYCSRLRIPQDDVDNYAGKLRLLQHGLIHQAHALDALGKRGETREFEYLSSDGSQAEDESQTDCLFQKRRKFVHQCLHDLRRGDKKKYSKHEGAREMRREVIKQFLGEIAKTRRCASCGGISPAYRKDGCVKIFEKDLSDKEKATMFQNGLKHEDAMARVNQAKKPTQAVDEDDGPLNDGATDADLSTSEDGHNEMTAKAVHDQDSNPKPVIRQRYISAMEVQARLVDMFNKEQQIMAVLYNAEPLKPSAPKTCPDMFFVTAILVPPNRYRPEARLGDSKISEAQQNSLYKSILRACTNMARSSDRGDDVDSLHQVWTELQEATNSLIDKTKNPVRGAAAAKREDGIKQILEKKEGLFRKSLMGKRVNYAARSVISPDPNIETNEIGVPPVFAKKLTYPEPVTSHNFKELQHAVINGPEKWPGAFAVEDENGQIVSLRNKSVDERISLANRLLAPSNSTSSGFSSPRIRNKKVYRHLTNGDVVLMNRQPTLHKPSIMGHRVRVLPGEKTLRMHYANCNTYNADFDGDEMNMHFPQNEVARAEALQIADTDHQYLSGTQGKPLRGLIQDHISVSVALCALDTFLSSGDYQQLIYSALRPESGHVIGERIQLAPPAIIKPVPRWTGKQVITTILKNIQPTSCGGLTLHGKSQIKAEQWGLQPGSEDGTVLIRDGELLKGILDKSQIGQSSGGLIHAIHEVYGPAIAGKLLGSLGRLLTRYLHMRAFSCGIDDLRLTSKGESSRLQALQSVNDAGLEVASAYVSLSGASDEDHPNEALLSERLEEVLRDDKKQEGLDLMMNARSKDITAAVQKCLSDGLEKPFPRNQMQVMTTSGAKGSRVNASLISCNLGQQVLESRRVPLMISGKTLPCFAPFETNIRANGYISGRFLTGIRPQEYFFHHMAGREGLIDTAVKTSRSGYLQRCIIKGLEGLLVAYDNTVRDADGSLVQFLYGEDGLDAAKQKYLTDFSFILRNVVSEAAQLRHISTPDEELAARRDAITRYMKSAIKRTKRDGAKVNGNDPLTATQSPATNLFATSEFFYEAMSTYLKENPDGLIREKKSPKTKQKEMPTGVVQLTRKNAEMLFATKYLRSFQEPGEAVGIIAGQSVGEPSTQMTLNTFHLAGHSAANVTQGIPRLREILMTAAKVISTPSMTLVPKERLLSNGQAKDFVKSLAALPLSYILDSLTVEESIGRGKAHTLAKIYKIKFNFFPSAEYTKLYAIAISDVIDTIQNKLLPKIIALAKSEIRKRSGQQFSSAAPEIGVVAGVTGDVAAGSDAMAELGENDEDGDEEDATSAKQRNNRSEAVSYGPNDDDDENIQRSMEVDAAIAALEGESDDEDPTTSVALEKTNEDSMEEGNDEAMFPSFLQRAQYILETYDEVAAFDCDEETGEWCCVTLEFNPDTPKFLMIPGIGSCKLLEQATQAGETRQIIHVEGANLKAMQRYSDAIYTDRIRTSDIAAVLSVYGVEACRSNIVGELSAVFKSHGIEVDTRHLSLIADYMTRNGSFTAFNRIGLRGNVSPFTKMSFETTLEFLKDALLDGDSDELATPSSRLVMGRLGKLGTGSFDILTRLPTCQF